MTIGLFDSGLGGLSVRREIVRLLPEVSTVYLADTKHFPYGPKSEAEVQALSSAAVGHLLAYKPDVVVVACNTASTSALTALREQFPAMQFVGIVPALKPAVAMSTKKKIAVLATARTLASTAYTELKRNFAEGVTILDQACPGWVELVEQGHSNDTEADQAVRDVVEPLARQGVDAYVLGCTHYPFLRSLIQHYAGNAATVLDSGEAVARQVQRLVSSAPSGPAEHRYLVTGSPEEFRRVVQRVEGQDVIVQQV